MNDRDDYSDNPYRGRTGRDSGRDHDPLGEPTPPPSRGRRARSEGPSWPEEPGTPGPRSTGPSSGEFRTPRYAPRPDQEYDPLDPQPPAGRGRPQPPAEPDPGSSRRRGAADALRGGRAARSGAGRPQDTGALPGGRPGGPESAPPSEDPTQDALAALAGLGSPVGSAPAPDPVAEEPPRRRRRRSEPEPEPEPTPPVEDAPRGGRRSRRAAAEEEAPPARRGRGRWGRGRRDEEPIGGFLDDLPEEDGAFDSGSFPGVNSSADTGAFAAVNVDEGRSRPRRARDEAGPIPEDEDFAPTSRRGRRHRGAPEEEAPAPAPADEPTGSRTGRRRRGQVDEPPADTGAFITDEEPRGRRARRGRREPEPIGGFADDLPEEDGAFDSGSFPGVNSSADTGAFAAVNVDEGRSRPRRARDEEDVTREEPRDRRSRRRRGAPVAPDPVEGFDPEDDPEAEPEEEPTGRRGRGRGRRGEGPRRGRRRGRRDREPEEDAREPAEADDQGDHDDYEEPALADIAAAYGGDRSSRKKAKELKRARLAQQQRTPGGRRAKRRGKGMVILLCLALIAVVGGGGFFVMRTYVFPPDFSGEGSGEVVYVIEENQSGLSVGQGLTELGVVASPRAFTNALEGLDEEQRGTGLVPGSYSLALGMSAENAVLALLDPENRLGGRVTIKEGKRNDQVAEELSLATGVPQEELMEALSRTDELGLPEYAVEGPAGYLFPETYRFDPETDALTMIKAMVSQFNSVAEEMELVERSEAAGHDPNEIMAMASIIQAESGGEDDMPKVSRVIYNRLDIEMNLGMDSTCFYAIGTYGIALTNDQLELCRQDTSGFDTYFKKGLPPGPFVAPGRDAIEAALEPAEGPWLYFVTTDPENGVTKFTDNEAEFQLLKEEFEANYGGGSSGDGE
ncbi:endolytic transglycosylase MltG [Nocardiopsis sp. N85]|uniref:endolytic transglycosylase MltG n=1 Tax=Nocardiopsis sp. N85 TaxID=3029400 RepID=UPI00237F7F20|nr:endolytic transglycosylase MltG [Nocardiopsis sp. N85]MDE3724310.1 endolytic transglycosylase MltG [Nocardiopsis sp. N85]